MKSIFAQTALHDTYAIDGSEISDVEDNKVGLFDLVALIVGGTIGSGIFALPASVTRGAGTLGILIVLQCLWSQRWRRYRACNPVACTQESEGCTEPLHAAYNR